MPGIKTTRFLKSKPTPIDKEVNWCKKSKYLSLDIYWIWVAEVVPVSLIFKRPKIRRGAE